MKDQDNYKTKVIISQKIRISRFGPRINQFRLRFADYQKIPTFIFRNAPKVIDRN